MVSPSRSSSSPRGREDVGKLFLGALVLLGLVASVFLVLSDRVQIVRVGLVIALWAAVLGAWAVSRYQGKIRDLRRTYEVELEREISARREHDLGVEARVRSEVGADASEMAALRAELAVLRRQLQRLFDGELPPERPALRASATRVQELPSAQDGPVLATGWRATEEGERRAVDAWANAAAGWSHAADAWVDTEAESAEQSPGAGGRGSDTPVYDSDHPGRPRFASRDDDPVTAETAIVRFDDEESPAPGRSVPSWSDAFTEVYDDPDAAATERPAPLPADEPVQGPPRQHELIHGPPAPEVPVNGAAVPKSELPKKQAATTKSRERTRRTPATATPRSANSRRRRTQAADPGGSRRLSVAEIMANLSREEEQRSS
ncbi:DUF6779 domain-containing protein [Nocardia sp. NPDC051750]|uniref:DUF6779 domain-containing protein n=1 Tax=Nocardia sp. NPDC051750 TaxID=3364325 RepID=UPI0037A0CAC7